MPQIRLHGITLDKALSESKSLVDTMTESLATPRDYFTIQVMNGTFIKDGSVHEGYPFVEVLWFDRGREMQDLTAQLLTRWVHSMGYPSVDVFFIPLERRAYYENAEHFGG